MRASCIIPNACICMLFLTALPTTSLPPSLHNSLSPPSTSAFSPVIRHRFRYFQKQRLPHLHTLLVLATEDSPSPEEANSYGCAELLNIDARPRLFYRDVLSIIHGPCCERCLKNGHRSKGYPHDICDETVCHRGDYPAYRCRPPDSGQPE